MREHFKHQLKEKPSEDVESSPFLTPESQVPLPGARDALVNSGTIFEKMAQRLRPGLLRGGAGGVSQAADKRAPDKRAPTLRRRALVLLKS